METRALILTSRFPSALHPDRAPYNVELFSALGRRASIDVMNGEHWSFDLRKASGGPSGRRDRVDGFKLQQASVVHLPLLPSASAALMASTLSLRVWHRIRTRRIQVIVSANAYPDGVAAVYLGRAMNLPVVIKCRGPDLREAERDTLGLLQLSFALRRASHIAVTCDALVDRVRAFGVPLQRIHVVHEGLDRGRFRPRDPRAARRRTGLPEQGRLVLFVGNLSETSGWRTFLAAANRLRVRMPDVAFIVVGAGPLESLLRQVADSGPFIPVGTLAQEELAEYMAAVDLVCLPGIHYGLPSLLRETLASGRPVVVRRTGGIPEVMTHQHFGRMVNHEDPATLSAAMEGALLDESAPAFRSAHAFLPSWEDSAERLCLVMQASVAAAWR